MDLVCAFMVLAELYSSAVISLAVNIVVRQRSTSTFRALGLPGPAPENSSPRHREPM
jgi:hypothetical protein